MIFVTGAAGFIGSALVWELNQRGVEDIICVDDFGSSTRWHNLVKRKFKDFIPTSKFLSYLESSVKPSDVRAIFHFGACSSTTEMNMDFLFENNVKYSQRIFDWCRIHNKQLVYASSCATYGAGHKGFSDSTSSSELRPLNPYGYSKVLFDRWVEDQNITSFPWAGLKFSNVYGPQEYHKGDQASVVFKAFYQIRNEGRLKLFRSHRDDYKDGLQKRDFVYVKDVVAWSCDFLDKKRVSGIFNIGYGVSETWMSLAEAVFNTLQKPVKIEWIDIPESIRAQYQYYTEARVDKLLTQGFEKPRWSLEEGIKDYCLNYLSKEDLYL